MSCSLLFMMSSNNKIAELYCQGHSRRIYGPKKKIVSGMKAHFSGVDGGSSGSVCVQCNVLRELHSIFDSFLHTGQDLK